VDTEQHAEYHKLLQRQIRKTLGENPNISPELQSLLQRISETYDQADDDHELIERSLELSSKELSNINKSIEEKVGERTEELQKEHIRFMSSINSLGIGFIMCDTNDRVMTMNPAIQKILASRTHLAPSRQDWTINEIDGLLRPGFEFREALHHSRESGEKLEFREVELGHLTLRLFISPIVRPDQPDPTHGLGVVVLVEDVTEQAMIERSRNEFFSIASHELRTPLTAIQGNAEIMKKYYSDQLDPALVTIVGDIHESAARLIQIVSDFLDASALEQGKMPLQTIELRLQDLIHDMTPKLESICNAKGLRLILAPELTSLPVAKGDPGRIKQVIYNLVSNAAKYTEQGSVTINGDTKDGFVFLSVTDTGRGMSADDQHLLFRKFQQAGSSILTRDTPKGTGLGLYISKLIIEHSGGTIGLSYSEVGKGSSFVFSLPQSIAVPSISTY
jgi:signal transduction histidine kinase